MTDQLRHPAPVGVKIAGVSVGTAAMVWLVGLPLISLAGVIPGSDAPYAWMGIIGILLAITVAPAAAIGVGRRSSVTAASRVAGLVVCAILVLTAIMLWIGAAGGLGERAPRWVAPAAEMAWVALFLWMVIVSFAAREPSTLGRAMLWLGTAVGASVFLTIALSALMFYLNPGFVYTNATILPSLLVGLVIWLCPAAWFTLFAIRLWAGEPLPEALSRGQQLVDQHPPTWSDTPSNRCNPD